MKEEQRSGLKAGLISGAAWAALMTVATLSVLELNYSAALAYYTELYNTNGSSALGGMTPVQYITYSVEVNALVTVIVGVAFGALIGYLFISLASRFLMKQSYIVKGVIISVFLWLLYELGLTGFVDPYEIFTSLAVSLFAGYLLGFLYTRYSGPPPQMMVKESDHTSENAESSRTGGSWKSGSKGSQP